MRPQSADNKTNLVVEKRSLIYCPIILVDIFMNFHTRIKVNGTLYFTYEKYSSKNNHKFYSFRVDFLLLRFLNYCIINKVTQCALLMG